MRILFSVAILAAACFGIYTGVDWVTSLSDDGATGWFWSTLLWVVGWVVIGFLILAAVLGPFSDSIKPPEEGYLLDRQNYGEVPLSRMDGDDLYIKPITAFCSVDKRNDLHQLLVFGFGHSNKIPDKVIMDDVEIQMERNGSQLRPMIGHSYEGAFQVNFSLSGDGKSIPQQFVDSFPDMYMGVFLADICYAHVQFLKSDLFKSIPTLEFAYKL